MLTDLHVRADREAADWFEALALDVLALSSVSPDLGDSEPPGAGPRAAVDSRGSGRYGTSMTPPRVAFKNLDRGLF